MIRLNPQTRTDAAKRRTVRARVKGAYTVLAAEPKYPTVDLDPETVEAIEAAAFEVYQPEHRELFRMILFGYEAEMGERDFARRYQLTLGGAA